MIANIVKNIYVIIKCLNILGFYYIKNKVDKSTRHNIRSCLKLLGNENRLFVKLFQALAYNNKINNEILTEELSLYCENVPYNDNELEYCLSMIPSSVLRLNSYEPIASGLISLVFEGKNKNLFKIEDDNNEYFECDDSLIIKVKRPNIYEILQKDMEEIKVILNTCAYLPIFKYLNLNDIFEENFNNIIDQTNFLLEINNIKKFYQKNKNIDYIEIPFVINEYSNNNCIKYKKSSLL